MPGSFQEIQGLHQRQGVSIEHREEYDAINIVYKSLQQDREQADITDIIRQLHQVVDEAIDDAGQTVD